MILVIYVLENGSNVRGEPSPDEESKIQLYALDDKINIFRNDLLV